MTCANWAMTALGLIIFGAAVWPGIGGGVSGTASWVIGIAAVLIVALAWTGVECRLCERKESKA